MKWFRTAAEQGDTESQNNLGAMYAQGQGVPRDVVRAYAWFNLAAEAGNQRAAGNRSIAARQMTTTEFVEAQKLAATNKPPPP
jgi:TPR repeat protein